MVYNRDASGGQHCERKVEGLHTQARRRSRAATFPSVLYCGKSS